MSRHSGMVRRTGPGISRFRVRLCEPPRNDDTPQQSAGGAIGRRLMPPCSVCGQRPFRTPSASLATHLHGLAAHSASELCQSSALLKIEGAGKAGRWPRPWPACRKKQAAVTTGLAETPGLPCAMALTAAPRSPRGPAFLPPSSATPSSRIWHQQRDARTTRLDRARRIVRRQDKARCDPTRPPHPAPHVRDDREAPLMAGTGWRDS